MLITEAELPMGILEILDELIKEGEDLAPKGGHQFSGYNDQLQPNYVSWRLQSIFAIEQLGGASKPLLHDLESDRDGPYFYVDSAQRVLGVLRAARAIAERQPKPQANINVAARETLTKARSLSTKVFVVHGHDEALRERVARFLEKLGLKPIVLLEQPDRGRTVIEKLSQHSDVSFAVVLFTPDDVGKGAKEVGEPKPRARQNVIFELGYFIGKLGRESVCVLYDESVELPTDYRGVLYIKIDAEGAWRMRLAKEIKEAGLPVDMNKAI